MPVDEQEPVQKWSLRITGVEMSDVGEYTCTGGNTYGSIHGTVTLSGMDGSSLYRWGILVELP